MEAVLNDDNTLLEMMECPVCLKYITKPPIRHCENGHIVCSECVGQLVECPTCRGQILNSRNRIAENLTSKLIYPCENEGCREELKVQALEGHSISCMYQNRGCLVSACVWMGSPVNLKAHLLESHLELTANLDVGYAKLILENSWESTIASTVTRFLTQGENVFTLLLEYSNNAKTFHGSINCNYTEKCNDAYIYKLKFCSPSGIQKVVFQDKIKFDTPGVQQLLEERRGMYIKWNYFEQLLDDKKLKVIIFIEVIRG